MLMLSTQKIYYSFIEPVCEDSKSFRNCLTSIINQKYVDSYEVTILDNGSYPQCTKIAKSIIRRKQQFYIHKCKNNNMNLELPQVFNNASGMYIIIVDPQTEFDSKYLNKIEAAADRFNLPDIIRVHACTKATKYTNVKHCYNFYKKYDKVLSGSNVLTLWEKPDQQFMNYSLYVFKRELLLKLNYYLDKPKFNTNVVLIPALLLAANKVVSLNFYGVTFNEEKDLFSSIITNNKEESLANAQDLIDTFKCAMAYFKVQNKASTIALQNFKRYCDQQINRINNLYYNKY